MNEYVKYSIDARKKAIFDMYTIEKEENLKKVNDLFERIEKLGLECKNAVDFEAKFGTSELAMEYSNLFVELNNSEKNNYYQGQDDNAVGDYIKEEAKEEVKFQAKRIIGGAVYGTIFDAIGDDNPDLQNLVLDMDDPLDNLFKD